MSCPCDEFNFPVKLKIGTGQEWLSRALGGFPDWRMAILNSIGRQPELYQWRARGEQDLGMMLVDMGAYLFDSVSFYDSFVANESYIKTAFREGTDRKLISILGYIPRPAMSAQVWLAAEAEGKKVINMEKATAFRSAEFDGNVPQVFETEQAISLDPRVNKYKIDRVKLDDIPGIINSFLVIPNTVRLKENDPLLLVFNESNRRVAYVDKIENISLRSKKPTLKIILKSDITVPANSKFSELRVYTPGNATGLWTFSTAISGTQYDLESTRPIRAGSYVILEHKGVLRGRKVTSADKQQLTLFASSTSTIKDTSDTVTGSVVSPAVKTTVTRINLDNIVSWPDPVYENNITIYFNLVEAAKIVTPDKETLIDNDVISIPDYIDESRVPVSSLLFEDVYKEGIQSGGTLDYINHEVIVDVNTAWDKLLMAPVNVFGNAFIASRGETVIDEILGVGDATQEYQEFKLKQKPLSYLPTNNSKGYSSTLSVRVGNILWDEVDTFYATSKDDTVYVVRHNEENETYIKFGGAARLPTAAEVTASYRYGAGSEVPPAESITQLAKPIDGITNVKNILPAFGGGDAESMDEIKYYAPRSALLLGRTVSLLDIEAAANQVSGVKAVKALWRWDKVRSEKRAIIYYIGDAQLSSSILSSLKAMSEPDAPIEVKQSLPQTANIQINLVINQDYSHKLVIADVQTILYEVPSAGFKGGLLRAEKLGPEGIVYNSHMIDAIMEVNGVNDIESITFDSTILTGYGRQPEPEHYFEFGELGTLSSGININGVV